MQKVKRIGSWILAGIAAVLALPAAAMAQTYTYTSQVASTSRIATDVSSDIVVTIMVVLGFVAGIWVLVVGVTYAFRKIKKAMRGGF